MESSHTIADLESASSVLGWDQETYMPSGGTEYRAEQIATLSSLAHRIRTSREYVEMLAELRGGTVSGSGESLAPWQQAIVRESARESDRAAKLPEEHVASLARATTLAQEAWKRSRAENDFSVFAPQLRHLVDLKRQETEYIGYSGHPYDALVDLYEPGMNVATLRPVFDRLKLGTVDLLRQVTSSGVNVDDSVLYTSYDSERQLAFARETIAALGFNFQNGRVDLSSHPFCTTFAVSDVRLTTRVFPNDLRSCLFGLIHEAGHGMYEQGIDSRYARTVVATGVSMGIHESQSLLWENMIARSRSFWRWAFPRLQSAFHAQLAGTDEVDFYRAINVVKPSLIRIEADDLTYNLHILLRFEIEQALIGGELEVDAIPARWNDMMEEYLGLRPQADADGCLQDVHWSFAGFGYFPSYTLGKLYAAMFYQKAQDEIPELESRIERGDFSPLLTWLREAIHVWGKSRSARDIVMSITGGELSEIPFLQHNRRKIADVYGIGA